MTSLTSENKANRLQDRVILIINGLSESGRILAEMLANQGADVAIVSSQKKSKLTQRIRRDVQANGRRCLVLTPESQITEHRPFPQFAIQKIVNTLGQLDAFISYSENDVQPTTSNGTTAPSNGRLPEAHHLFDEQGLTLAALRQIQNQKRA